MAPQLLAIGHSSSVTSFASDFGLPPPPTPLYQRQRDALDLVAATDFGLRAGGTVRPLAVTPPETGVTEPEDESDYFRIVRGVYDQEDLAAAFEGMGNAAKSSAMCPDDNAEEMAREQSLEAGANLKTFKSKISPANSFSATDNTGKPAPNNTKPVQHPLLRSNFTTTTIKLNMSNSQNYGTIASDSAQASSSKTSRPKLPHAQTTTPLATTPQTLSSNSLVTVSTTLTPSTDATTLTRETLQRNTPRPARPSLLRSLTTALTPNLDLNHKTSHTTRHAPLTPSHWTHQAHRATLLAAWDNIHSTSTLQLPRSLAAQLKATETQMLAAFPELGTGEVVLGKEWIVYVLGTGLRAPFYSGEKMGRWEVLGGIMAGGGRGAWGMM